MSDHFFRKPIRIGNHVFTGITPVSEWPKNRDNVAVKYGYMVFDQYGRSWNKYELAALRNLSWNWN